MYWVFVFVFDLAYNGLCKVKVTRDRSDELGSTVSGSPQAGGTADCKQGQNRIQLLLHLAFQLM